MNNFQIKLDRYLTSLPEDDYCNYLEKVIDILDQEFYKQKEDFICDSDQFNDLVSNLFYKNKTIEQAKQIIEAEFWKTENRYCIQLTDYDRFFVHINNFVNDANKFIITQVDQAKNNLLTFSDIEDAQDFVARSNFSNLQVKQLTDI